MILYGQQASQDHSVHDAAVDDLAHGVESLDASSSSSYSEFSYLQALAVCDPYKYRYGVLEASSSSGYYPMQQGAPLGSNFAANVFG